MLTRYINCSGNILIVITKSYSFVYVDTFLFQACQPDVWTIILRSANIKLFRQQHLTDDAPSLDDSKVEFVRLFASGNVCKVLTNDCSMPTGYKGKDAASLSYILSSSNPHYTQTTPDFSHPLPIQSTSYYHPLYHNHIYKLAP